MIKFEREGNKVTTIISTSIGWDFYFQRTMETEPYAIFLKKDIESSLWNNISEIRRKAYQAGWQDRTRKNVKKDWFSGKLDVDAQFK